MHTTSTDTTVLLAQLDAAIERWDRQARRQRIYRAISHTFWASAALAIVFLLFGV